MCLKYAKKASNSVFLLIIICFAKEFILPGAHSIERYLVEDQLNLILDTYFLERKICAQQLLQANIMNKMPLHYIIVEVNITSIFEFSIKLVLYFI